MELDDLVPRLRGWLHLATAPVVLVAGASLVAHAPEGRRAWGAAVFVVCACLLFGVSAALHRGTWSPHWNRRFTRADHASIFLLIAGSYTPFALSLLEGGERVALLAVAWGGALLGITFRLTWRTAPRWVYTPIYLVLGWVSVFFLSDFADTAGSRVIVLLGLGGLLYTIGAVVYGFRRPNPFPQWFGFHEVFHAFTVLAFMAHFSAVSIATYSV